MLPAFHKWNI